MKREIIKQMIEIAGSKRAGDLSYDIMSLKDYDGQFVWSISGETITSLQKCSKRIIKDDLLTERGKYFYARNGYQLLIYHHSDSRYFWCGAEGSNILHEITREKAEKWAKLQYQDALQELQCGIGFRLPIQTTVGELIFNCDDEYVQEQLKFAEDHDDDSLKSIFDRLKNYPRCADDHKIYISKDISDRSFIFTERINGEVNLSGGIIYHGYPEEGYTQNGSVQLKESFGWSMHT